MLNPSTRSARAQLPKTADQGGLYAYRPRAAAPLVLALGLITGTAAVAQDTPAYQPPPLFSGQGHQQLTTAGTMPPATAPGATAASPVLDPAIRALVDGQSPESATQLSQGSEAKTSAREDVPWTLRGENRPWSLHFTPSNPIGTLYLSPPGARDARMMLPGAATDAANRARFAVNKFITDAIGISAQARARQMDTLDRWIENSTKQLERVRGNDWEHYQFSVESGRELQAFRAKVTEQAAPDLAFVQSEIERAVSEVSPLLEALSSYELQMAWYNVMVQMKEGFTLYQAQVQRSDQQLLSVIDNYLAAHPYVPRPAGAVPPQGVDGFSGPTVASAAVPAPTMSSSVLSSAPGAREPAQQPPPASDLTQPQSAIPGLIVGGLILALLAWFALKIRNARRQGGKGVTAGKQA